MEPTLIVLSTCLALWLARMLVVQLRGTEFVPLRSFRRQAAFARRRRRTTTADVASAERTTAGWRTLLGAVLADRLRRPRRKVAALQVVIATLKPRVAEAKAAVEQAKRTVADKRLATEGLAKPLRWSIATPLLVAVGIAELYGLLVVLEGLDIDTFKARMIAPGATVALLWLPEYLGSLHRRRDEQHSTGTVVVPWGAATQRFSAAGLVALGLLVVAIVAGRGYDLQQASLAEGFQVPQWVLLLVTVGLAVGPVVTSALLGAATTSHAHRNLQGAEAAVRRAERALRRTSRRLTSAERKVAERQSAIASRTDAVERRIAALGDLQAGVLIAGMQGEGPTVDAMEAVDAQLPEADVIPLRRLEGERDDAPTAEAQ